MFWARLDERFGSTGRASRGSRPAEAPGRSAQRDASRDASDLPPGRRAHRPDPGPRGSAIHADPARNAIVAWLMERGTPAPAMLDWLRDIERQTSRSLGALAGARGTDRRLALALLGEFASAHHLSIHEAAMLLERAEPLARAALDWLRRQGTRRADGHPNA